MRGINAIHYFHGICEMSLSLNQYWMDGRELGTQGGGDGERGIFCEIGYGGGTKIGLISAC